MKLTIFSLDHTRVAVQEIRPLPPLRAVAHFLLAGLLLRGTTYYLLPLLVAQGLAPFEAFVVTFMTPLAVLFALAFAAVQQEGVPMTARAVAARLRLRPLTWRQVGWTVQLSRRAATIGAECGLARCDGGMDGATSGG